MSAVNTTKCLTHKTPNLSSSCIAFWSTSCLEIGLFVSTSLMASKLSLFDCGRLTPKPDVHFDASEFCNF